MKQRIVRATIKQVASAAGVSTQTVSRVLNEKPDVSPETRGRVQSVIRDLNYQPSAVARSLIRQRSFTLGVVTAGLKHIGPSRTLNGITSVAEEMGYAVLLKELHSYDSTAIQPIFEQLISHQVDGIFWAVPEVGGNHSWVQDPPVDIGVPIVYITMQERENLSTVAADNYQGGRMAMAHLIEQGYQRIGHISGPLDWWEARQRFMAWNDALVEMGMEADKRCWVEGNWSSGSGAQAVAQLMHQYPELDAIFVANDQMALSVLQYASQHRIAVPQALGVIGFDNMPEAAYFWPPLSTVHQDHYNIAKAAVEQIVRTIEAERQGIFLPESSSIVLSPSLVIRQSTSRTANPNLEVN